MARREGAYISCGLASDSLTKGDVVALRHTVCEKDAVWLSDLVAVLDIADDDAAAAGAGAAEETRIL